MAYTNAITKVIGIKSDDVTALNTEIAVAANDANLNQVSGAEHINAGGKRKPYGTKPGQAEATGDMEFILTPDTVAILDLALLEDVNEFEFNEGDGLRKATGCKVTSLSISGESGGNLIVSLDFSAGAVTDGVAITADAAIDDPYICFGVTSGIAGGVDMESFEISVDNGLENVYGMVNASRLPAARADGYQNGTFSINFLEDPSLDPIADSLASTGTAASPIELTIAQEDGNAPSVTFEFEALRPADTKDGLSPETIIKFDSNYVVGDISYDTTDA